MLAFKSAFGYKFIWRIRQSKKILSIFELISECLKHFRAKLGRLQALSSLALSTPNIFNNTSTQKSGT